MLIWQFINIILTAISTLNVPTTHSVCHLEIFH